jgi:hypothetical protein
MRLLSVWFFSELCNFELELLQTIATPTTTHIALLPSAYPLRITLDFAM